ncbi:MULTISPECIES: hypothetical protein [unclassified Gilliamella]|uniref:hypothetical protein n=1 Tax=unclassified Gilliamella TaxID=2685620 RepID=UPI00226A992E|nr:MULTISPECIES: hypothetical protein [unclassified Gilliamella]MCX8602661.1 hypothetical protein [Gilliamella sp. B3722]MCX8611895.1 hypothetical protein [Gilliamella sp. B3891]MCX8614342.1 hypothetical protein [Gilliamella sp. B3773]MCX8615925.1 hypothetical protein [Gilliamella sp. B3770]MCX8621604.1 hypothetical protein [Gilliamella sp. B3892]
MEKIKKLIEQASKLVNMEPLPDDAEEQLNEIIEQADSDVEKSMLSSYAESLFVERHS